MDLGLLDYGRLEHVLGCRYMLERLVHMVCRCAHAGMALVPPAQHRHSHAEACEM